MVDVYAWPPVAVAAQYWTMEQPVSRSRSIITGASYVTAAQRRRLVTGFDVAGWPRYSAGFLEALWRYLDGGVNLVRLSSFLLPCNGAIDRRLRGAQPFEWETPPAPIPWITPPSTITWFDGVILSYTITTQDGFPAVRVTGLPPNSIVAVPGEFITVWIGSNTETHMIAAESISNGSGVATITLVSRPSATGQISIGTRETGVFEIVGGWPNVMTRSRFSENYTLQFRQVFEDERGPFNYVNPWGRPSFLNDDPTPAPTPPGTIVPDGWAVGNPVYDVS